MSGTPIHCPVCKEHDQAIPHGGSFMKSREPSALYSPPFERARIAPKRCLQRKSRGRGRCCAPLWSILPGFGASPVPKRGRPPGVHGCPVEGCDFASDTVDGLDKHIRYSGDQGHLDEAARKRNALTCVNDTLSALFARAAQPRQVIVIEDTPEEDPDRQEEDVVGHPRVRIPEIRLGMSMMDGRTMRKNACTCKMSWWTMCSRTC